jgi:hypothetical protein
MPAGPLIEEDDSRPPPSGIRIVFAAGTYRALEPLPDLSSDEGDEDDRAEPPKRPVSVPLHDPEAMRSFKASSSFPPPLLPSVVEQRNANRRLAFGIAVAAFVATLAPAVYFLAHC